MLKGRFINEDLDAVDTDEYWLERGYISVVPVSPDMTMSSSIKEMGQRFNTSD